MTGTIRGTTVGSGDEPLHRRRKAILTCPRCRHTSPMDGDWEVVARPHASELHCPDCFELLSVRPRFDE